MLSLVFDSNVYIAAMARRSFCYDLLGSACSDSASYRVYLSAVMLQEIEATSARLVLEQLLRPEARDRILYLISSEVHKIVPAVVIQAVVRDPDDDRVLECAVAAEAELIVTLDQDLISMKTFRSIAIVHPKTFFYMLPSQV